MFAKDLTFANYDDFSINKDDILQENKVQEDGGGVLVVGSSESPQLLDKLKKHFKVIFSPRFSKPYVQFTILGWFGSLDIVAFSIGH